MAKDAKGTADPATVRESLLNAARQAGPRYIRVRGIDLETAITGKEPAAPVAPQTTDNKPIVGDKK